MQDQVQCPESPLYPNHNVRKGISYNTLNFPNHYAPIQVFTPSAAFTRRSSITINLENYLQIPNQKIETGQEQKELRSTYTSRKNWCLYDPASLNMAKNTTTHTHNTFSCTLKFNDNHRRKTTKLQLLEQQ